MDLPNAILFSGFAVTILFLWLASAGLVKGAVRVGNLWEHKVYRKQTPRPFWLAVVRYYALSLLTLISSQCILQCWTPTGLHIRHFDGALTFLFLLALIIAVFLPRGHLK